MTWNRLCDTSGADPKRLGCRDGPIEVPTKIHPDVKANVWVLRAGTGVY